MSLPLHSAADVQDSLLTAAHDLDRLQRLLGDATATLMTHFRDASIQLQALRQAPADATAATSALHSLAVCAAITHLGGAVTALQFDDMAAQLIAHTTRRLRHCADRMACDAMGDGDDSDGADQDIADGPAYIEAPPLRPNPVTQDEVDAGSVELF